jgi:orotate phosphoribosyltransferase
MNQTIKELIMDFEEIGMLNFGEFTFKSGIKSPIYTNMRILISYPKLMKKVAKIYSELLDDLTYDRLGGIPYAGLPLTGAISLERDEPWVFYRKETKTYGLGNILYQRVILSLTHLHHLRQLGSRYQILSCS